MNLNTTIQIYLAIILLLCTQMVSAQCDSCHITVNNNSTPGYTVGLNQSLCIASNFTYTGILTLEGGTICNNGTVKQLVLRTGTFNNATTGKIVAASSAAMRVMPYGKLTINNQTGGRIMIDDSLNISSPASDSLIINIHKGSAISCDNLNLSTGRGFLNIGLAATTSSNNGFYTAFNVNGPAIFDENIEINIGEAANININAECIFTNSGIKSLTNKGVLNINNDLYISGDGQNTSTITINNHGEFSLFGSLNISNTDAVVNLNNYPDQSTSVMYVMNHLNINQAEATVNNEGFLQVGGYIENVHGVFRNSMYTETNRLNTYSATTTNSANLIISDLLELTGDESQLENHGYISVVNDVVNSGTIQLGEQGVLVTENFNNALATSLVMGSDNGAGIDTYGKVFVHGTSSNRGILEGYLLFLDFTYTGPGVRIDNKFASSQIGDRVAFSIGCDDDPPAIGLILTGNSMYTRPRTSFCVGEDLNLNFHPYGPIVNGPFWDFTTVSADWIPMSTGQSVPIIGLQSGGTIMVYGSYFNGQTNCPFEVFIMLTIRTASILTTSPVRFNIGNPVVLTSTVVAGHGLIQYNWSPNYFFVPPSNYFDKDPVVAPQVSLVYTVNMVDGYGCTASNTLEVIGEPFAVLEKELHGGYYKLHENQLLFKYDGQYDVSPLIYRIYDHTNTVVTAYTVSNPNTSNKTVKLNMVGPGDNRLLLDASALSSGTYILEVENEKKEKMYLRFQR
jgi:hypothetical protein